MKPEPPTSVAGGTGGGPRHTNTIDETDGRGSTLLRTALGLSLRVVALICALTLVAAVWTRSWPHVLVLAATGLVGWVVGTRVGRDREPPEQRVWRLAEAAVAWTATVLLCSVVTWALAAVSGAPSLALTDPLSAVFEATSGLTTTGLTMVASPHLLDPVMQWWRTVLQGAGAVGIVVFALLAAEPSGDRDEQVGAEWNDTPPGGPTTTARRIVQILAAIVALSALGQVLGGEPPWRALNHAVTAAATGGFAITPRSAADATGVAQIVLAATVLLGAISFGTLWGAVSRSGPALWRRTQVRTACVLFVLTGGTAIAFAAGAGMSAADAAFNAISASATAGFSAGDAHRVVPVVAVLTTIAMFVGGAAGSTAGGVKTARIAWIWKSVRRYLPDEDGLSNAPYRWDGEEVDADEAMHRVVGAGVLVAIWLVTVLVGIVAVMAVSDVHARDAALEVVSAASGTGLTSGLTGPELGSLPKFVLIATMLGGRIEFTAFVALVAIGRRTPTVTGGADGP